MRSENIFLMLLGVSLVALLVYEVTKKDVAVLDAVPAPQADTSQTFTPANMAVGPQYLTYNLPWSFAPPVGNFLPRLVGGNGGVQNVSNPPQPVEFSDCNTCGGT